jgi:hypothetical protein
MHLAAHVAALLEGLDRQQVEEMPPAARRRFAAVCRRAAEMAEPKADGPKAGVLCELRAGAPRHE